MLLKNCHWATPNVLIKKKPWQSCRSFIESIAQIDKSLHTEVVARIVIATLDAYASGGAAAVPWQQAELAMHLVYTFGEVSKSTSWHITDITQKHADDRFNAQTLREQHSTSFPRRWPPKPLETSSAPLMQVGVLPPHHPTMWIWVPTLATTGWNMNSSPFHPWGSFLPGV